MYAGEEERQAAIPPPLEQNDQDQEDEGDNQLAEEETKEKPAEAQIKQTSLETYLYGSEKDRIAPELAEAARPEMKVKPVEYAKMTPEKPEPMLEPLKLMEPVK